MPDEETWAQLVDQLLSKHVEPTLIEPTSCIDYPVELSPFAKRHRAKDGLVERLEAFAGGMEFANAFSELNDPDDQRARFEEQRAARGRGRRGGAALRRGLHRALEHGMPPTGGIGIGIDRLVMLLTGTALDPRGRAVPRHAVGAGSTRSPPVPCGRLTHGRKPTPTSFIHSGRSCRIPMSR